jgi:hypothetical protein
MKKIIEICILVAVITLFFTYRIYEKPVFWVFLIIIVLVSASEFVRHYVFQFLSVVFGVLYLPMNMLLMNLTKLIEPFKKEDKIVYTIFRVLFFPLQVIVTIFSIPYEFVLENAH